MCVRLFVGRPFEQVCSVIISQLMIVMTMEIVPLLCGASPLSVGRWRREEWKKRKKQFHKHKHTSACPPPRFLSSGAISDNLATGNHLIGLAAGRPFGRDTRKSVETNLQFNQPEFRHPNFAE